MKLIYFLMQVLTSLAPPAFLLVGIRHGKVGTIVSACLVFFLFKFVEGEYIGEAIALQNVKSATAALDKLQSVYNLSRWGVKEFVDKDTLALLEFQGGTFDIIVVQSRDRFSPPLGALRAYADIGGASVIILPDEPRKLSDSHRFFVYHEIGHLTPTNFLLRHSQSKKFARFCVTFLPCLFVAPNWWVISLLILSGVFTQLVLSMGIFIEPAADSFAAMRLARFLGAAKTLETLKIVRNNLSRVAENPRIDDEIAFDFFRRLQVLEASEHRLSQQQLLKNPVLSPHPFSAVVVFGRIVVSLIWGIVLGFWGQPLSNWMVVVVVVAFLLLRGPISPIYINHWRLRSARARLKSLLNTIPQGQVT